MKLLYESSTLVIEPIKTIYMTETILRAIELLNPGETPGNIFCNLNSRYKN